MKTATVRDIRTRFPLVEGWLAESGVVAITKAGKLVAKLVSASPADGKPPKLNFAARYAAGPKQKRRVTDISGILIRARE